MKPGKAVLFSAIGIILMLTVIVGLFIHQLGYENLKRMYTLNTGQQSIIPMDVEGEYVGKSESNTELLKERMNREGWTFTHQEGAGYFFEKDGQEKVVTIKKLWNRHYVLYDVEDNVVDLSG